MNMHTAWRTGIACRVEIPLGAICWAIAQIKMLWTLLAQRGRSGCPAFDFLRCEIRTDVRAIVKREVAFFRG